MKLTEQKCEACRADTPPLSPETARDMMREIPEWTIKDNAIERVFQFKDFKEAMKFVYRVADAAKFFLNFPQYVELNSTRSKRSFNFDNAVKKIGLSGNADGGGFVKV